MALTDKLTKNYLAIDTESTTIQVGHSFTKSNKLCSVGCLTPTDYYDFTIEYNDEPYGDKLAAIQKLIDDAYVLVLFNAKHDLHWLRRYGIKFQDKRVWDVQLGFFEIGAQLHEYPSLDEVSAAYGFEPKLDVVKLEYWAKGLDTTEVPLDILLPYQRKDCELTAKCFLRQMELLEERPKLFNSIRMSNMDLLVLEEMEWNGILTDIDGCREQAEIGRKRINEIDARLNHLVGFDRINWNSGNQLSIVLYGGTLEYIDKGIVRRVLKSGKVSERLQNVTYSRVFERIVNPIKGSELAKPGFWSVSEDVLKELTPKGPAKEIVRLVLERHKIAKLVSTYYEGIPKLIKEMEWEGNFIHGNLNQCVAITGRLSSTKPNMQNMPPAMDKMFRSRYAD